MEKKNGTNTDRMGKGSKYRDIPEKKAGRPKVNRELVIKNLLSKDSTGGTRYTRKQIAKMFGCVPKTITRIYNEAIESGLIKEEDFEVAPIGIVEADFESECLRARGYSFMDWLYTKFKNPSQARSHFNFSAKIWENVWDKCDLLEFADPSSNLADQMAIKFVNEFKDDANRMRSRLKKIRFILRFLRRTDINDAHFKMSNAKHPRSKRRIPEISQTNFGTIYTQCEDELRNRLGNDAVDDLRLKIVTQMRTGHAKQEREFYGIQKGTETKSYLSMVSPDEYMFHIFAKQGEEWDVIWMPSEVKEAVFKRYQELERGDYFVKTKKNKLLKAWGDITEEIIGFRFILHDLRKISLTWLYVCGVPLEVATQLNVGWKDLSTAQAHYIEIKRVLRKSFRKEYRSNIPDWFKEGLDDFTGFEAVIEDRSSSALGVIQGTNHYGGF